LEVRIKLFSVDVSSPPLKIWSEAWQRCDS